MLKAFKKDKKVDIEIDTPKVDVDLHITEETKEFKLDSEKLDVQVVKTKEGTTVVVESENKFFQKAGTWLSKFWVKKFNK